MCVCVCACVSVCPCSYTCIRAYFFFRHSYCGVLTWNSPFSSFDFRFQTSFSNFFYLVTPSLNHCYLLSLTLSTNPRSWTQLTQDAEAKNFCNNFSSEIEMSYFWAACVNAKNQVLCTVEHKGWKAKLNSNKLQCWISCYIKKNLIRYKRGNTKICNAK